MMGLRTSFGVQRAAVDVAYPSVSAAIEGILSKAQAARMQEEGLLEVSRGPRGWEEVRATSQGRAVLDTVVTDLLTS